MTKIENMTPGHKVRVRPFSAPNRNSHCEIVAVISLHERGKGEDRKDRWDTEVFLRGFDGSLTLTDTAILANALRAVADKARERKEKLTRA